MNDKQKDSSSSTKDIQLNISSSEVRSLEELEHCLEEYGECEDCQQPNTGTMWCRYCNAERFKSNFKNWTSGSEEVDNFIREIQLKANNMYELIEWIDFDQFENIEYLAKGGFSTVFKATWADGYIKWWSKVDQKWRRSGIDSWGQNGFVCLKSFNDSANMTSEFFQEIRNQLKFRKDGNAISVYGITKDPNKEDYIIVLKYAAKGSLRQNLDKNYNELSWDNKLNSLVYIAKGLADIHKAGLLHKDFHVGNIVMGDRYSSYITDFGLCKPASESSSESNGPKKVYGVLPYVAPEVLKGGEYVSASDVYSFGIIMVEIFTGYPPYHDLPHDEYLAIHICQGLRPKIKNRTPQLLLDLVNSCLDAEPKNRISSKDLEDILTRYYKDVHIQNKKAKIYEQICSIEESTKDSSYNPSQSTRLSYATHTQAVYTSRLLDFRNLPNPINSAIPAESKQLELVLPDFDDYIFENEDKLI